MKVETFEVTEVVADGKPAVACDAEALKLIEELGLDGQKSLVGGEEKAEKSRCPYRKMTKEEAFVYGQLCPKETLLTRYADESIPLRVLQVAAHAKSLNLFNAGLLVLHPESADVKDPVLIGKRKTKNEYGWDTVETYILARWGKELDALEVMKEAALKKAKGAAVDALAEILRTVQRDIATAEHITADQFINGKARTPTYHALTN